MTTLASDLIESTRRHLFTGQPEKLNKLASSIGAGDTTFALTYDVAGVQAGTVISIDLEEIFVFMVNTSTKTISDCQRGYNGSTAATHASGAVVTSQPKFSQFRILQALNDDLNDLSSPSNGMFQIKSLTLTFNPVQFGYDMTGVTDIISLAELRYRLPGPTKTWPRINRYALTRNMPTTGTFGDFPSGFGLVIYETGYPGYPIQVRYRAPFTAMTSLSTDVVAGSGLPSTAVDIPPLGAAIRLVLGREVHRNFDEAQVEPRRAEEVPPQAAANSVRGLMALRQQRIQAEAARLTRAFSYESVDG